MNRIEEVKKILNPHCSIPEFCDDYKGIPVNCQKCEKKARQICQLSPDYSALLQPKIEEVSCLRKQPITDKIFSAQDLEEARRRERERIIKWVEKHRGLGYCDESCFHITNRDWVALSGKGGENE